MGKFLIILFTLFLNLSVKTAAQNTETYFDKNLMKTPNVKKAKYVTYAADTGHFQAIYYVKHPKRIFAKGKIYPANYLTFDGKAVFEGQSGELTAVRYYQNGVMKPLIFTNGSLQKSGAKRGNYYMTISEKGFFYAYEIDFSKPDMSSDQIIASGRVTDTITLRPDGMVLEYDYRGSIIRRRKFIEGRLAPFIVSNLDIKEPYEVLELSTHTATISNVNEVQNQQDIFVQKCRDTGADGLIGIKITLSPTTNDITAGNQNLIIQGTLIRLKTAVISNKKEDK